jgi:deazaflavin-dependent oxidoreductase (nitroreductase family)
MAKLGRSLTRIGNRAGVWMYRHLNGRLSSGRRDIHVLMITVPGRQTGLPRSTCIRYLDTPDGLLVWGTGSGSPHDPDWFQNLRHAHTAQVRLRDRTFTARPRELTGDERATVWHNIVLARAPQAAKYARRAQRVIPVALLEPL